jgi:hypothetical protein
VSDVRGGTIRNVWQNSLNCGINVVFSSFTGPFEIRDSRG